MKHHDTLTILSRYSHDTLTIRSRYSHDTPILPDTLTILSRYAHDTLTILSRYSVNTTPTKCKVHEILPEKYLFFSQSHRRVAYVRESLSCNKQTLHIGHFQLPMPQKKVADVFQDRGQKPITSSIGSPRQPEPEAFGWPLNPRSLLPSLHPQTSSCQG